MRVSTSAARTPPRLRAHDSLFRYAPVREAKKAKAAKDVIMPMVEQAGIDLIWFGIYIVVVVEMSQITPPIGLNLFVIQGLTGRDLLYLARAALPFFGVMVIMVTLLILFPEMATYLPQQMTRG